MNILPGLSELCLSKSLGSLWSPGSGILWDSAVARESCKRGQTGALTAVDVGRARPDAKSNGLLG